MPRNRTIPNSRRDNAFAAVIRSIPPGKVATYGQVAAAAGYPRYHRQVAQFLRLTPLAVPWQRVVGSGGLLKTRLDAALEQRLRLQLEGVGFHSAHVDLDAHLHHFQTWLIDPEPAPKTPY